MSLSERLLAGDARALARGISRVEGGSDQAVDLLQAVFSRTGRATVVGLTGPPGAGKSSLVDRLVACYRAEGRKVGVIAVDPSSAFSGGAILGDRVRMMDHARDDAVFIRSMATRGHLGGLSRATNDAIDLMDAAGYDPILVETVGVGQDEVDVVKTADVVAVVLVPGMGDDIQAIKAGILEIADLFVINKADRDGADRLHAELDYMLSLVHPDSEGERPPIAHTVAVRGTGIEALRSTMAGCLERLAGDRRKRRRRERAEARFMSVLTERTLARVMSEAFQQDELQQIVDAIAERTLDPYSAAGRILRRLEVR